MVQGLFRVSGGWEDHAWEDLVNMIRRIFGSCNNTLEENKRLHNSFIAFEKSKLEMFLKCIFITATVNAGQLYFSSKGLLISLALTLRRVVNTFTTRIDACSSIDNVCQPG